MWYNGILFSHKKNEILSFAAKFMDLENIMLSQTQTNMISLYVESKKKKTKRMYKAKQKDPQIQKKTSG